MIEDKDRPAAKVTLKRRLFVLRLASIGGAGVATSACMPDALNSGAQPFGAVTQGIGGPNTSSRPPTGLPSANPMPTSGFRGPAPQANTGNFSPPMRRGVADADPSDAPRNGRGGQRGTGVSDSDPSDQPGQGRGNRAPQPAARTGVSDSDPSDQPGQGRGNRAPQPAVSTGVRDSDPSDQPGQGRGSRTPQPTLMRPPPAAGRTGLSDNDPTDQPGFGRGVSRFAPSAPLPGYGGPEPRFGGTPERANIRTPFNSEPPPNARFPSGQPSRGQNGNLSDTDPSDLPGRGRRGY